MTECWFGRVCVTVSTRLRQKEQVRYRTRTQGWEDAAYGQSSVRAVSMHASKIIPSNGRVLLAWDGDHTTGSTSTVLRYHGKRQHHNIGITSTSTIIFVQPSDWFCVDKNDGQ